MIYLCKKTLLQTGPVNTHKKNTQIHTHTDCTRVCSYTFNVLLADQIQASHLLPSPERLSVCVINPNTTAACLPALTPLSSPLPPPPPRSLLLFSPPSLSPTAVMKFNRCSFPLLSCAYSFLVFSLPLSSLQLAVAEVRQAHSVSPSSPPYTPSPPPSLPPSLTRSQRCFLLNKAGYLFPKINRLS